MRFAGFLCPGFLFGALYAPHSCRVGLSSERELSEKSEYSDSPSGEDNLEKAPESVSVVNDVSEDE